MARRGSGAEITATLKDDASKAIKNLANAVATEADKIAKSDDKLASSAERSKRARQRNLTATDKLRLAMEAERAAGDPLQSQIAKLSAEHAKATKLARSFAQRNAEIPPALIKQAVAAEKAMQELKDLQAAKIAQAKADEIAAKKAADLNAKLEEQARIAAENIPKTKTLREQVNDLKGSYAAAGIAIAAATTAAVAGTIHLTTSTAELGDKIAKTSRRMGISTNAYQAFDHAMNVAGTSMDQQGEAISKISRKIRDAAEGVGTGAKAFERMGISVRDSQGNVKSSEAVILEVADAFSELPDGVDKAAISMDLFEESGTKLIEFLNMGSEGINTLGAEAIALGGVMSNEATAAAEQFNDALGRFNKVTEASTNKVGQLLVAAFVPMLDKFTALQKQSMTGTDMLKGFVKGLIEFGGGLLILFTNVGGRLTNVFKGIQLVGSVALLAIIKRFQMLAKTIEYTIGTPFKLLGDAMVALGAIDSNPVREFAQGVDQFFDDATAGVMDNIEELGTSMAKNELKTRELSEGFANMAGDMLHAVDAISLEVVPAVNKSVDAHEREFNAVEKTTKAVQKKVKAQKLATAEIDKQQAKELKALEKVKAQREKDADAMIQNVAGPVGDAFKAFGSNIKDLGSAFKEFGKSALNSVLTMVETSVMAYAAQSAAAAFSSQAGIPIVGPILGAAAMAAAFGLVRGLLSTFNKGGVVPGDSNGPNRDSVLSVLTPGEIVLPRNLSKMLLQVAGRPAATAANAGGMVQAGAGIGGITVNMIENNVRPRSPGQLDKFVQDQLVPSLTRLKKRGFGV